MKLNGNDMQAVRERYDTLILGLGKTGISCVKHLLDGGESVAVADSRGAPPELERLNRDYPQVPVYLGAFNESLLSGVKRLIMSPGLSRRNTIIERAIDNGVEITSDIELFCRSIDAPLVAVTGSNGKSTVVSLLAQMIERAGATVGVGGNIGHPALDLLSTPSPDYYLLELSSFQLETVSSHRPVAAAVLNVSPDHLDRYQSLAEYARAKENIFAGDGAMIINQDDALIARMKKPGRKITTYSLTQGHADFTIEHHEGESWLVNRQSKLLRRDEINIPGLHNVANVMAALALGEAINLPFDPMLDAVRHFTGLPHRCEWVGDTEAVKWINDSKGTNVGATIAALEGFSQNKSPILLIAGGDGKGADFSVLRAPIGRHVKATILIGKDAENIAKVIADQGRVFYATSLEAAVSTASKLASPGDIVLLSPACASFDMFSGFEERGDIFKRCVHEIGCG